MTCRNKDCNPAKRFQTRGSMISTYTLRPEADVCDGTGSVSYNDEGEKNLNQYTIKWEIGVGAFGKVKFATNNNDGKNYAIKVQNMKKLKRKLLMSGNNSGELLKKEIAIMKKINHPNLLTLYEVIEDPEDKKMYMVMEYIDWGPLMSKKHMIAIDCETNFFPEDKLRYYMRSF